MNRVAAILLCLALTGAAKAATFTVTNTAPSDSGSLRQAILGANANFGPDEIVFAIPGTGVHTITLSSGLPAITDPVILDGYTQPGSSPNTLPVGQGLNTVLTIEIDGSNLGLLDACLTVNAGNGDLLVMSVQGLVINRCPNRTIVVGPGGDGAFFGGNFIGTDPTGTTRPPGPNNVAIIVDGADGVVIGGSTPSDRNLLSSIDGVGVLFQNSSGSLVRGNLFGTNAAGNAVIPASPGVANSGVAIASTAAATIGGASDGDANVIAGFATAVSAANGIVRRNRIGTDVTGTIALGNGTGVRTSSGAIPIIQENVVSGNATGMLIGGSPIIIGNFVGTDATGTIDVGNETTGIFLLDASATVGGTGAGEGNIVAYNGTGRHSDAGIFLAGIGISTLRANRVFANSLIGIDLDGDGVTPNDPFDFDTGGNGLLNFPMITSVVPVAATTHVEGRYEGAPAATLDLDFFASPVCRPRPQGPLQAETYLGALSGVTTDGNGIATFAADFPVALAAGQAVTATATDAAGNTSELSQGILLSVDPAGGPPAGGVGATLTGMLFEAGAAVTVGGAAAANVTLINPHTITVTMPARSAGSLSAITVTNADGTTGTLPNGWLANFLDVPGGQQFYDFVAILVKSGISGGVGGGLYGIDNPTLRQQMAVFLLKAEHGVCFVPPPCAGVFADVPCPSQFADWIEALAEEGVTGGCGGGAFCPQNPVRRDQMAVFLLKTEHGPAYVPPPCTGMFGDVACPSTFADWIERLAIEQITGGCGGGNYCPLSNNTRGQMAVFITKTFGLQ